MSLYLLNVSKTAHQIRFVNAIAQGDEDTAIEYLAAFKRIHIAQTIDPKWLSGVQRCTDFPTALLGVTSLALIQIFLKATEKRRPPIQRGAESITFTLLTFSLYDVGQVSRH